MSVLKFGDGIQLAVSERIYFNSQPHITLCQRKVREFIKSLFFLNVENFAKRCNSEHTDR